jgi:hypothetical protein
LDYFQIIVIKNTNLVNVDFDQKLNIIIRIRAISLDTANIKIISFKYSIDFHPILR